MRGLLDRGAVGLVTTHDLALTEIAGPLARAPPTSTSRTRSSDGEMTFDYRMRPGVVRTQQRAGADAGGRAGGE